MSAGRRSRVAPVSPHDLHHPTLHTDLFRPAGAIAETQPRNGGQTNVAALTSGRLMLCAIVLPAAAVITSITFAAGSTAATLPNNQWFALYDKNLGKLGVTADDTSAAWSAAALKTLALSAQYTVPATDLYYLGVCVVATTPPTLAGVSSIAAVGTVTTPAVVGLSTTGLTTPATAPNTAAALASVSAYPYAYVS